MTGAPETPASPEYPTRDTLVGVDGIPGLGSAEGIQYRSRAGQSHWTWRYHADRDMAYGRRVWLSLDPERAAEQLANLIGAHRARDWASRLLAALLRRAA